MTELRFHKAVYVPAAVDEGLQVFANFARFEQVEEAECRVIRLTCDTAPRERRVAGELGNYVLGLTVKSRGQANPSK